MITDKVAPLRFDVEPWFLTGFDFRCMWEAMGLDRLPFPLAYRMRGPKYMSELEAQSRDAIKRQGAALNPYRVQMLQALRYPALLLEGFGWVEDGDGQRVYRLFGVIGQSGHCAVITQDPSDEYAFGSDVQIMGCANTDFPKVVIEALPDYTPGTRPRKDGSFEYESPEELLADCDVTASIMLSASADFNLDYEMRDPTRLILINVADDGAYLVNESIDTFQIIPATIQNLLGAFKKVEEQQLQVAERLSPEGSD